MRRVKMDLENRHIPLQGPQHQNLVRSFTTPAGNYLPQQYVANY